MVRKISFAILAVAVVVISVIGFQKLRYWDRSVRIFSMNSDDMRYDGRGRGGRGGFEVRDRRIPGGFEGRDLPDSLRIRSERRPEFDRGNVFGEMPDSIRTRFESREGDRRSREQFSRDSIPVRPDRFDTERMERARIEPGFSDRGGRGRDDFRRGRQVRLRTVLWFLAVFAGFTVVSIYVDKVWQLIRKKLRSRTRS